MREIQNKKRYLFAFLIGSFLFVLAFAITYSISYLEYQRILTLQSELTYKIFEDKLGYSLFGKETCAQSSFEQISEDLSFQGKIIDDLEQKFGKDNRGVLLKKKFYTLIELEHIEFLHLLGEKCKIYPNIILFFYSNSKENIERSEDIGNLLDTIYNRNPRIFIYSFDVDLNSSLIAQLSEKYEIEGPPTVIIDNGVNNTIIKIFNPKNLKDIEQHLK